MTDIKEPRLEKKKKAPDAPTPRPPPYHTSSRGFFSLTNNLNRFLAHSREAHIELFLSLNRSMKSFQPLEYLLSFLTGPQYLYFLIHSQGIPLWDYFVFDFIQKLTSFLVIYKMPPVVTGELNFPSGFDSFDSQGETGGAEEVKIFTVSTTMVFFFISLASMILLLLAFIGSKKKKKSQVKTSTTLKIVTSLLAGYWILFRNLLCSIQAQASYIGLFADRPKIGLEGFLSSLK